MNRFTHRFLVLAAALSGGLAALASDKEAFEADRLAARSAFLRENPGAHFYVEGGLIGRVYGQAFGGGGSPEESAWNFISRHSKIFGVAAADLEPASNLEDARHTTGVYYQPESDNYRFTLVYYRQVHEGIPVFRAEARLLVRNEPGFPLVLASSSLRSLGDFSVPAIAHTLDTDFVFGAVQADNPDFELMENSRVVIWAGVDDVQAEPALAVEFIADNGRAGALNHQRYLYLVDAVTGDILYKENLIVEFIDVAGNVGGLATQGPGADACDVETLEPYPYAQVSITGGSSAFADVNGDFIIANAGSSPVTVTSGVNGRYFRCVPASGGSDALSMVVTPPGPANFVHNSANSDERIRALTNVYLHANVVRDVVIKANPNYPTIANQTNWPANVNINQNCNAFYNGSSINFYVSGGGCNNTGYSSVVHHEYGHHIVSTGGSGQGAYGEGMGDVMSVVILDDPRLGVGFQTCASGIRNAINGLQYPCSGEIHFCGQLISGCVWETREELVITEPVNYHDILQDLSVNAVLLHTGTSIAPDITIDWLTLDDNDGNIGNGTPHYNEIATGFGEHNMDAPPLELLSISYPNGVPSDLTPNQAESFDVKIDDLAGTLKLDSPTLHYRVDGGAEQTSALTVKSGRIYEATLPGIACESTIDFWITAQTTQGGAQRDPDSGSYVASAGRVTVFTDNFETDKGWTVQNVSLIDGAWGRGVPAGAGDRGDPTEDYDGSGQCQLTDNTPGNSDVDGGPTRLVSPVFDLSAGGEFDLTYARWFMSSNGTVDSMTIEASDDNGASWTLIETVPNTASGWVLKTVRLTDFVSATSQVLVRFNAIDNPNDSVTEAAIDAVSVSRFECGGGGCTGNEAISKTACKNGKLKVKTAGGNPGETVSVTAGCGSGSATVKANGTATVKVKPCSGNGTATAGWTCGASANASYSCN